ncbi:unnamed protein product, partial [Amoebophrya sp. A25]
GTRTRRLNSKNLNAVSAANHIPQPHCTNWIHNLTVNDFHVAGFRLLKSFVHRFLARPRGKQSRLAVPIPAKIGFLQSEDGRGTRCVEISVRSCRKHTSCSLDEHKPAWLKHDKSVNARIYFPGGRRGERVLVECMKLGEHSFVVQMCDYEFPAITRVRVALSPYYSTNGIDRSDAISSHETKSSKDFFHSPDDVTTGENINCASGDSPSRTATDPSAELRFAVSRSEEDHAWFSAKAE